MCRILLAALATLSIVSAQQAGTPTTGVHTYTITTTGSGAPPGSTSTVVYSTTCAAEYAQCGGMSWTGATCCQTGYTCQVQNPYYSQCLVDSAGGGSASGNSPSSSTPPNSPTCGAVYQQCGGANWTGATCCQTGYTCQVQNPYYSQCL